MIGDRQHDGGQGHASTAMRLARLFGPVALLLLYFSSAAADSADPGDVVRSFVDAFDRHDLPAVVELAHPDIEWLSVSGSAIHIETQGIDALKASISAYFESCGTCRAAVDVSSVNGQYVAAVETATWSASGIMQSQASTSIYEIVEGQVRRVWYFPPVTRRR